jgi:hypothetical protein
MKLLLPPSVNPIAVKYISYHNKFGSRMFTKMCWVIYLGLPWKFVHWKACFTEGRKRMSVHTWGALRVWLGVSYRHIQPFSVCGRWCFFGKSVLETKVGVCRLCHVTKGTICSLICSSVVSSIEYRTVLRASVMDVVMLDTPSDAVPGASSMPRTAVQLVMPDVSNERAALMFRVSGFVTTSPVTKRRVQGETTVSGLMEQGRDGQRPASVVKPVGSLYLALAHHRIVSWVSSFNPTHCFLKTLLSIIVPLHLHLPISFPFIFPNENFVCICDVWLAYLFSVTTCVCLLISVQRPSPHFLPPGPIRKGLSTFVISWKMSDALLN